MSQDSIVYVFGTGVIGVLVSVVGYLYRSNEAERKTYRTEWNEYRAKTELDLAECRKDREKLWEQISQLRCSIPATSK
jgi:hypothetical protein